MARWQKNDEKLTSFITEANHSLDNFFKPKNYQPSTDEEKHIFDEFSLITSSMAILIHIASADRVITPEEKKQIINDIIFQLEQRPHEFTKLSEKFGNDERNVIYSVYDKILKDYQAGKINLDEIVEDICLVYKNNPEKSYYLLRLSYYCAHSDNDFDVPEKDAIAKLAKKLHVPNDKLKQIEEEVLQELGKK